MSFRRRQCYSNFFKFTTRILWICLAKYFIHRFFLPVKQNRLWKCKYRSGSKNCKDAIWFLLNTPSRTLESLACKMPGWIPLSSMYTLVSVHGIATFVFSSSHHSSRIVIDTDCCMTAIYLKSYKAAGLIAGLGTVLWANVFSGFF